MARASGAETYGDWGNLHRWLRRKRHIETILDDLEGAGEKLAKAIKRKAIAKMRSRDPSWPKLADATIEKKGHDQPFIDTGSYIESIKDEVLRTPTSLMIIVGPEEGVSDGYYDYQYIGKKLEFGSSTIPARPLWRPLMQEVPNLPEFKAVFEALYEGLR